MEPFGLLKTNFSAACSAKDGTLEVIAEGLRSPQGIAFDAQGKLYVAEQGRNRILVFENE